MNVADKSRIAVHLAMLINMLSLGSLMMVMPLGPDLVRHLGMEASHVGYISGGATLAAALSALIAAPWLDRFDRKRALIILLVLRFALLFSCALAADPTQLIALFVLSGLVAGPMGAILMATMLDLIPPAERGRKLAYIGMGFSLAAILVIPLALECSMRWNWTTPFVLLGCTGLFLALLCQLFFPAPASSHRPSGSIRPLLASRLCLAALAITTLQMFGHFLLVPHFATYFQFNVDFPRENLGLLYLFGGLASIAAMRIGGAWIDRGSTVTVALVSSGSLALVTLLGFAAPLGISLYVVFTLFMALSAVRSNSTMTIAAGIPPAHQRAAFMAFQGTVSNIAAGFGSLLSARYLTEGSQHQLLGFEELAALYAVLGIVAGLGVLYLIHGIKQRDANPTAAAEQQAG
ncbi:MULTISPECIES: MFS transporter [Pseudomonadaceae]|uniref:MFS transporter n=1 Tax=Pseudomonadaceae TaxID=135621 RepID=UPI0015E357A8|nr:MULTISPECIES: MFS transporter [Pseudomonadaceae]MBA1279162.1 MFS transporter [Stutzerimonas stutzeri]QXY90746.1 MFS transporter [Pseudomonas sp. MTM4]